MTNKKNEDSTVFSQIKKSKYLKNIPDKFGEISKQIKQESSSKGYAAFNKVKKSKYLGNISDKFEGISKQIKQESSSEDYTVSNILKKSKNLKNIPDKFGKILSKEIEHESSNDDSINTEEPKKTTFKDGFLFGLACCSFSILIATGSMGTLAIPVIIILFILLIYCGITSSLQFWLGYFLTFVITIIIIIGGFLLLVDLALR